MVDQWRGFLSILFIPATVDNWADFRPPADFLSLVTRRVWWWRMQPGGEDRSLAAYLRDVSSGNARMQATIADPITLYDLPRDQNATRAAINAHPDAHLYDVVGVIFPENETFTTAQAVMGPFDWFDPPRPGNRIKGFFRVSLEDSQGTWFMELLHSTTRIGDYYNYPAGFVGPGDYEAMDTQAGTHPTAFTKSLAGWLAPQAITRVRDLHRRVTLHPVGTPQPPPAGRTTVAQIWIPRTDHLLFVEARTKSDRWERGGFSGANGIDSEGVIVLEHRPEGDPDPWPRAGNSGPFVPLGLLTRPALRPGESYRHAQARTTIRVVREIDGGFEVDIDVDPIVVPSTIGMRRNEATELLEDQLLRPRLGFALPWMRVRSQDPAPGSLVAPHSAVELRMAF